MKGKTMEIELKYIIDDDDLIPSLMDDRMLTGIEIPGSRNTLSMRAIYFDTEDGDLLKDRAAFRARIEGDRYVATFKANSIVEEGVHKREEINIVFDDEHFIEEPDLSIFGDSNIVQKYISRIGEKDFIRLMEMHFVRELFRVKLNESIIEVCMDQGDIYVGDETAPICEMEMELQSGIIEDVKTLGEMIENAYGLVPSRKSKFARGLELIG